ncbi:MAG TPA: hypothetical protein VLY87_06070 [Flavobacterium sp.]|nr:hypothetical protein [Flavobacterium sp.]
MKSYLSIISLCCIALVSCAKQEETPKVIYETEKSEAQVNYQKIDSTEIKIADLPVKFSGTNYLLHPVGDVRVYNTGSSKYGSSKTNQVSYTISNYSSPEITGYISNVMFQHKDSLTLKPLTANRMEILSITYLDELALKSHKQFLVYTLVDVDTNRDGRYDDNDIKTLYVSKIDGSRFTKLTPDFHELLEWKIVDNKLYFRSIEDINKNGEFDSKDAVHYSYLNLLDEDWNIQHYDPLN